MKQIRGFIEFLRELVLEDVGTSDPRCGKEKRRGEERREMNKSQGLGINKARSSIGHCAALLCPTQRLQFCETLVLYGPSKGGSLHY